MKKRHVFSVLIKLKMCLFLYFPLVISSQENSQTYLSIINEKELLNSIKQNRIDSLFIDHELQGKFSQLAYDSYDYMVWLYRSGFIDKAIESGKKCIETIPKLYVFDSLKHKKVYNNVGFFYQKKGDYYNAFKFYKKLTSIGKVDSYTQKAYRLAGRNLMYIGDFYGAAEYFDKSVEIAEKVGDIKWVVVNSIDAGINYKEIGTANSLQKGIQIMEEAKSLIDLSQDGLNKQNSATIPLPVYFSFYENLANLYNDRDDYNFTKSKVYYDKALNIALELKDSTSLSHVYNSIGFLYTHQARHEALNYLDLSLSYKPDKKLTSIVFANKGLYYFKHNKYEESIKNIQLAINELAPIKINDLTALPDSTSLISNQYKYELLENLIDKSEVWLYKYKRDTNKKDNLMNALKTLRLSDYLVDLIRFESNDNKSKLHWRKIASKIYTLAVEACFYLNDIDGAFYFMEKNKSILLLEDVSLRKKRYQTIIPHDISNREYYLKKQIRDYSTDINKLKNKSSNSSLFGAKQAYIAFIDSLPEKYQSYYKLGSSLQPISVKEAQSLLKGNEVYLEYILGNRSGYGILIDKNDKFFFEIKNYSQLLEKSHQYRKLLEEPIYETHKLNELNNVGFFLYNNLFPADLRNKLINKKLTIIPDAYLQNMPFEALITTKRKGDYLVKLNEISYAYSVTFLTKNQELRRENENEYLAFAPINFAKELVSLPNSENEVNYSSSLFSSSTFLLDKASIKNFKSNSEGYSIVHLATHSSVNEDGEAWITFNDGNLTLSELYLTKNTADLVVLSSCKTSIGKLQEGEGVMSLARGFFNSGAKSVLSTLWNANDKASFEITTDFYRNIKKGHTKSKALHLAKLNYITTHQLSEQSPYYWSNYILIGDGETIPIKSKNKHYLWLLFAFFFLLISCLVFFNRKK